MTSRHGAPGRRSLVPRRTTRRTTRRTIGPITGLVGLVLAAAVAAWPVGPASAATTAVPQDSIDLMASDLEVDPGRGVIYASVPSRAPDRPNSVAVVDPDTGEVVTSVPVGSEPDELAISGDGAYLYVALDGAGTVQQLALPGLTLVRQFAIGTAPLGPLVADDLEVMPQHPDVVAIARSVQGFSPRHQGVAIYDKGVQRPTTTQSHTGSNEIEFSSTNPNRIYGQNTETTEYGFRRLTVSAAGVTEQDVTTNLIWGSQHMVLDGSRIYGSAGRVIDAESRTLLGTFPSPWYAEAPLAVEGAQHRAYTLSTASSPPVTTLRVFDTDRFTETDGFRLAPFEGVAVDMVSWAPGRLAVALTSNSVLLLEPDLVRGSAGEYTPLSPERVLDTRHGIGRGGRPGPLAQGEVFELPLAGKAGIPSTGVEAVVLNATVTQPTAPGFLTIWPTGSPPPEISNLNFVAGQTVANLVTVALGERGSVSVLNPVGSAHLIFDVAGYYATTAGPDGNRFHPLQPQRAFDTRDGTGGVPVRPLTDGGSITFTFPGTAGVPRTGATAVVINVTVVGPASPGFLTVHPADGAEPVVSNVNFVTGRDTPNLVVVRLPASGQVRFVLHAARAHLLADVVGVFDDDERTEAGRLWPFEPFRAVDTRQDGEGTLGYGESLVLGDTDEVFSAYVMNVTVVTPASAGFLTAYPYPGPVPLASNLNFAAGQTVPNLVMLRTGPQLGFVSSASAIHLLVDVFGAFT